MEKINKPLPSGAYPNEHDPSALYATNSQYCQPTQTIQQHFKNIFQSSDDTNRRRGKALKNYCGIVVKKSGKISRQVGNFINAHRLLPQRHEQRQVIELNHLTTPRNYHYNQNYTVSNFDFHNYQSQPELIQFHPNLHLNSYGNNQNNNFHFDNNKLEFYDLNYGQFDHKRYSEFYDYENFKNHGFNYRTSFNDLTDLDIDRMLERDTTFHLPMRALTSRETIYERYRRFCENNNDDRDDNYVRLYESLSRLDRIMPKEKYAPGRVHYEREYRIYGRDTVALIYYKTCYL